MPKNNYDLRNFNRRRVYSTNTSKNSNLINISGKNSFPKSISKLIEKK